MCNHRTQRSNRAADDDVSFVVFDGSNIKLDKKK